MEVGLKASWCTLNLWLNKYTFVLFKKGKKKTSNEWLKTIMQCAKIFYKEAHAPNISLTRGSTHILVTYASHLWDTLCNVEKLYVYNNFTIFL